jgi:hypothetical protein
VDTLARMLRVGLLIALVSSLLLAPSAGAVIQLDRAVAGARLGNTKSEVRAALGKPRKVIKRVGEFGPTTEYRYRGGIRVLFLGGRVTLAGTTGLGDRTNRGVGVGSSEQKVKNRVPGVACETFEGTRICSRGAEQPGERGTFFFLRQGKVVRAEVAVLID